MLLQFVIFLAGLGVLYLGAEWLVRGAATIALRYGIRPLVVGATVVALGTSMPEFVVNFFAALTGEDSLALGNIVGSNICNIALILGASALVVPLGVAPGTLKKEYSIMMAVMVLFFVLALDGVIGKIDGVILTSCLACFFGFLVLDARRHARRSVVKDLHVVDEPDLDPLTTWRKVLLLVGGTLFLAVGARLMVYAAVNIARYFEIDPVVIGLTIVAIGTSLPELAASIVSALRNEVDISVGNILGSNLLNVLFVVGLVSLMQPLTVEREALTIHFPVMLGFGFVLLPIAWTHYSISRPEGAFLLASFLAYITYLLLPYF